MRLIEKLRAEILFGHGGQKKSCVRISYLVISDLFGDIYIYRYLKSCCETRLPALRLGAEVLLRRTPYWSTRGSGRSVISPRVMSPKISQQD